MDINTILIEITTPGSLYDEIMDNIITPRYDLKPELISELSISFLENSKKIETIYKDGFFKYYFINACRNQIHSSTSPFHKNNRIMDFEYIDNANTQYDDDDIELKKEFEYKLDLIHKTYKQIKKSWFENAMFEEYFIKNKTYRQIEAEYGLDHSLVWLNVKKVKDRLIEEIKKKQLN